jgi:hypothetical protein
MWQDYAESQRLMTLAKSSSALFRAAKNFLAHDSNVEESHVGLAVYREQLSLRNAKSCYSPFFERNLLAAEAMGQVVEAKLDLYGRL